jgi:hypothetical protein
MVDKIQRLTKTNSEICRFLLFVVSVAYRPLYLAKIGSLCKIPGQALTRNIGKIVAMCGSFLTVRDDQVYLIHQSAKDYLRDGLKAAVFQPQDKIHFRIFSRSLELMSSVLQRDLYALKALGFPTDKVIVPAHNPLTTTRYSCFYWVDHLYDSVSSKSMTCTEDLQGGNAVHTFLRERYFYWLEALSLCESMPAGVVSMIKLEALFQVLIEEQRLCRVC